MSFHIVKGCALAALLLSVALLLGTPALAQTRGISVVPVTTRQGQRVELYKGSHALLVGVSDYTAGWPDLESIPGELDQLQNALARQGFSVTRVKNPDSRGIKRAFEDFIDKYGYDQENRLLFFYSGHGYTRKLGRRQKGYLVPADAPNPNKDEKGFARKALTMSQVQTWAREIEAKHALFLFDSCFSGTVFKSRALPTPRHISDKTTRPVRQFITAGSAGEEVPANSVFLPSFIRAIEGEGDINGDGYVTGTELGQFLHEKVLGYNAGQTPQYGKIQDPALDEGDFVFPLAAALTKAVPRTAPAAPSRSIDAEEEFWKTIRDSNDKAMFQAYLREYPRGRFAALARVKIKQLEKLSEAPRTAKLSQTPQSAVVDIEMPTKAAAGIDSRAMKPSEQGEEPPKKKLAIFAPYLPSVLERLGQLTTDTLQNRISKLNNLEISYPFLVSLTEKSAHHDDIKSNAWSGFISKEPNDDFIYAKAKELDADYVLIYTGTVRDARRQRSGSYKAYLYDIHAKTQHVKKGKWISGVFHVYVADEFMSLLSDLNISK